MRAGIVVNVTPEDRRQLEAIAGDRNPPEGRHGWSALHGLPSVPLIA
jgi:hypothetical protein